VITTITGIDPQPTGSLTVRNLPDHLQVSWPVAGNEQHALVLDAAGRAITKLDPRGAELTIGTSTLAAGIYQLILTVDGKRMIARFLVSPR